MKIHQQGHTIITRRKDKGERDVDEVDFRDFYWPSFGSVESEK